MAMDQTILKQTHQYLNESNEALIPYIKAKLENNEMDPNDLLNYALKYRYRKKPGQPYAVPAETITTFGEMIYELKDKEQQKLCLEFYKLAAARDDSKGCLHYAKWMLCGNAEWEISKDASEALIYAEKALELATDDTETQSATYLKAQCHEALQEHSDAMQAYCEINDKAFPYYTKVIEARARLLKNQIKQNLTMEQSGAESQIEGGDESSDEEEQNTEFTLPGGVRLPVKFWEKWKSESSWFHTVSVHGINKDLQKRKDQIQKIIDAKKTEIELVQELMDDGASDQMARMHLLNQELSSLKSTKKNLEQKYKTYTPDYRRTRRRHEAEQQFFSSKRSNKRPNITNLAFDIIDHRFNDKQKPLKPIDLTQKSTRESISTERSFQQAAITLGSLGIPPVRENNWKFSVSQVSGTNTYGPKEYYKIGEMTVVAEHRTNPKLQRFGDCFLPKFGSYNNHVYPLLRKLIGKNSQREHEKKLATFMIRYGNSHQGVSLHELKTIYPLAHKEDVSQFNSLCFLIMEKEQSQWLSATDEKFQLGMTVAQARCLIMIEAGFIGFKEAFENDSLFGVYSQTKIVINPEKVKSACDYIETLYIAYLQQKNAVDHLAFLKRHIKDEEIPSYVLTREQAHQDLLYVYGGDSDTDGEEYDTDLEGFVGSRFSPS